MITKAEANSGPITREQWAGVVARNKCKPVRPHGRRQHERFCPAMGTVKLVFTLPNGPRSVPVVRTVPILDISEGGLAVKSDTMVPLRTGVGLDVDLEEQPLLMMGKVARCTSTIGGYQIGIELVFPEPASDGARSENGE